MLLIPQALYYGLNFMDVYAVKDDYIELGLSMHTFRLDTDNQYNKLKKISQDFFLND